MTSLLRFVSVLIGAGGVIAGVILFVQAQPPGTYGEVNSVLVGYGIGLLISGLFWSLLGLSVAKAVDAIEGLRSMQPESDRAQGQSSKTNVEKTESEEEPQRVEQSGGGVIAIIAVVVLFAIILVVVLSSGG